MAARNLLAIIGCVLILQSCATAEYIAARGAVGKKEKEIFYYLIGYVKGKHIDELVKIIGYPDKEEELAGDKVYSWVADYSEGGMYYSRKGSCYIKAGVDKNKKIKFKPQSFFTSNPQATTTTTFSMACSFYIKRFVKYCESDQTCKDKFFPEKSKKK